MPAPTPISGSRTDGLLLEMLATLPWRLSWLLPMEPRIEANFHHVRAGYLLSTMLRSLVPLAVVPVVAPQVLARWARGFFQLFLFSDFCWFTTVWLRCCSPGEEQEQLFLVLTAVPSAQKKD